MEEVLLKAIKRAVSSYSDAEIEVSLDYPEPELGDFYTNAALKLAAVAKKPPKEIAQGIIDQVLSDLGDGLASAEIAGPGFINFKLSDGCLLKQLTLEPAKPYQDQTIVVEFSDPNPFKILHAGHLYTSIIGDAIANLVAQAGAKVYRLNYGSDVGLHVGRSLWAILKELDGETPERLKAVPEASRSQWMSQAYVKGTQAYEEDASAKAEIIELNKRVYAVHASNDHDSPLAQIYWTTRGWSYDQFHDFYAHLGINFDKYYPESQTAPIGLRIVKEQLKNGVFETSDGAIVFRGEPYGLHTRVFISALGLPTYEAKDLGLVELKYDDYHYDRSIILTGNEIEQYMAVVYKALEQFAPELAETTTHLTHGMVKLSGGKKMSSRLGNIIEANDVIAAATTAAKEVNERANDSVVLAAIKYSMLKQRTGGDVIYDPKESVNVLGNSGPYLQYAHARARSILAKAVAKDQLEDDELNPSERLLVLKLSRYSACINQAVSELSPHLVCTYLYDLTQEFNHFYEVNRVIGDKRQDFRLSLVKIYADRLKSGLSLLGIEAPERL